MIHVINTVQEKKKQLVPFNMYYRPTTLKNRNRQNILQTNCIRTTLNYTQFSDVLNPLSNLISFVEKLNNVIPMNLFYPCSNVANPGQISWILNSIFPFESKVPVFPVSFVMNINPLIIRRTNPRKLPKIDKAQHMNTLEQIHLL